MASDKKTSPDPAVLAAQLEATRDDLAATLDEIVDRVSPKRAVGRAKAKVVQAVTGGSPSDDTAVDLSKAAPTHDGGIPREYLIGGAAAVAGLLLYRRHRRSKDRLPTRAELKAALRGDAKARRAVGEALDRAARRSAHEAAVTGRSAAAHARDVVEDAAHALVEHSEAPRRAVREQARRAEKQTRRARKQARRSAEQAGKHVRRRLAA